MYHGPSDRALVVRKTEDQPINIALTRKSVDLTRVDGRFNADDNQSSQGQSSQWQSSQWNVHCFGTLLFVELPNELLIVPAEDLLDDEAVVRFTEDLKHFANRRANTVLELNQQGPLPCDSIVYPLLDFAKVCRHSKIFVATRSETVKETFTRMTRDRLWITVDTGKDALDLIRTSPKLLEGGEQEITLHQR